MATVQARPGLISTARTTRHASIPAMARAPTPRNASPALAGARSASSSASSAASSRRRGLLRPVQAVLGFALPFTGVSAEERASRKAKLLARIAPLARGASATEEDKADVASLFAELEKANPIKAPLASAALNGRWKLLYTTSATILGTARPPFLRPSGPIYQVLDGPSLSAENRETFPFYNRVVAALEPETASRVAVQFKRFFIFGVFGVNAPPTARGKLDVTYLDDGSADGQPLRLSRGDKGNIFILEMVDTKDRPAKL